MIAKLFRTTLLCKQVFPMSILLAAGACAAAMAQTTATVTSPDKTIRAELSSQSGQLSYRIVVDGQQVLAPSALGIRSDNLELGQDAVLGETTRKSVNEVYPFWGAHDVATNRANEATVAVQSHGESYFVDLHVADDGVGVRLRLPAKAGRTVQADRSSWKLDGNPTMWVDAWDSGYESPYRTTTLKDFGSTPLAMPVTARVGTVYLTLTEAALKDYGDLALEPRDNGVLQGVLLNDMRGWTTDNAVSQPWRVTVISRDLTKLVNTTLVQNLNPPANPELRKAGWIKPGRSSWQWLATGDPKFEEQTQWVDWTRQLGFEYYLVDEGWSEWANPWESLGTVIAYAKKQNVKVWIWVHSKEVEQPEARKAYLQRAAAAGVAGVKIDFPPATNRWWSTWYWDTAKDAADLHLMLDFHGATKPTGMERTWPNVLTREGVRGHEYQITRYGRRLDAAHDTILPFTRYIAGPGDYTPTVFEAKELQGNTWAHELAQAVLFTSPFLCYGGNPRDYLANEAKDVLVAIPSVWDETRVLPSSEPGKIAGFARRSGNRWFIAIINGAEPVNQELSLDFLGRGSWKATELFDVPGKPDGWKREMKSLTSADHIQLDLQSRGGFVAMLQK